jgi:carboxyl-terminal processing protease
MNKTMIQKMLSATALSAIFLFGVHGIGANSSAEGASKRESPAQSQDVKSSTSDPAAISPTPESTPRAARNDLKCAIVPSLFSGYLAHHIESKRITDEVKKLTATNYLKQNDSSKSILLKSEADEIEQKIQTIFLTMLSGNCDALAEVNEKVLEANKLATEIVREIVMKEDYEIDESVELVTDPDLRDYSETAEARKKLLTNYVHFQMSNYLQAGTEMKDAKKYLVQRYERNVRRIKNQIEADLLSNFVQSFASALDPHSSYLSPDLLEDFRINMGLSLEGIGVSLSSRDGHTTVEEIIPGGAADRINVLKPKDQIISVISTPGSSAVNVIDMDLREVVRLIRGKKGSKVTLSVLRQTGEQPKRLEVTIVRDTVDLKQQAAKIEFFEVKKDEKTSKLAVIELPSFYGDQDPSKRSSYRDMHNLVAEAKNGGADGIVLDLSRNSGGLLEDSVKISGLFLRQGGIVSTQMSKGAPRSLDVNNEEILFEGPVVVLTSRLSASASEILAGALKDYRRAVIVGDDHTFGKGSIQSVINLTPGLGALKVTTGMFFRPGGLSTQHKGVKSDIIVPSVFSTAQIGERTLQNSLEIRKIEPFVSPLANAKDPEKRWTPLTDDILKELATRSEARIKASEDFKDILESLEKSKERKGVIRLSEVGKKDQKSDGILEDDLGDTAKKENEKKPRLEEALNILQDYVELLNSGSDLASKTRTASAESSK